MSAIDLAALVVIIVAFAAFVVLWSTVGRLRRTAAELEATADELRRRAEPLLADLEGTAADARAEVARVEQLLDAAEAITTGVESAQRFGYVAFRAPVLRFVAFVRGAGRALRRMVPGRRRHRPAPTPAGMATVGRSGRRAA
ncbi:MAG: hypothetical protein KDB33_17500 [Acidimicrobiales bacterium]|nr:hypothetical protein [Acidimicrobiales bacterium]MCB1262161.1 hypothetical protein [Acidimicrobiales bacterium]